MQTLIHKTALVINAGDEIGKVVAERLGALGANIILQHELTGGGISQTISNVKAMGSKVFETSFNLAAPMQVDNFFNGLQHAHPRIDIIIINCSYQTPAIYDAENPGGSWLMKIFSAAADAIYEKGHIIYLTPIIEWEMEDWDRC